MRLYGLGLALLLRQSRRQSRSFRASADGGFVYVIKGEHGAVKVGSSNDPERRLAELQTGSPYRLWIDYRVAISGPADAVEFAAHDILDAHRGLGEWFSVPTEAAIAAIHAAAFRLGVALSGAPGKGFKPDWRRRMLGAAALATPFWALLTLGHPVLAVGCMLIALVGFLVALLNNAPDAEKPAPNAIRWVLVAIGGAALPLVPFAMITAMIGAAHAEEAIPTYDATAYCQNLTNFMGGQDIVRKGCMELEATTKAKVERVWPQTSDALRSQCIKMAALNAGGTYQGLGGCLSLSVGTMWLDGKYRIIPAP